MSFWHVYTGICGGGPVVVTVITSVYYQILSKVLEDIKALDLEDIATANIQLAKVLNERETVFPGLPGILVLPLGQETMPIAIGTVGKDYIGYPVAVMMMDSDRRDTSTGQPSAADAGTQDQDFRYDTKLLWRERIRKQFINQRLPLTLPDGSDVYTCQVEPNAVVEATDWLEDNIWMSIIVLRFWSRESRG